ncbi:Bet v1-like protein [Rhizophagus irregularis]|uniref:Bet v1-like protein n=1 Tax=Rhizophagus irregularis TaxID=588596 RepID=A0A2N0RT29_9GLOM|nr:Bet v1-like protein [Rhizophagus irregularis]
MTEVYNTEQIGQNDYHYEEYVERLSEGDSSISFDPSKTTPQYHIQQAETALQNIKSLVKESGWKKISHHKSGVLVQSKSGSSNDKLPIFMGEHIIDGFTPQSIFAVIGMRKLWDEWYEEGNLIENLDETTSLTYMVMQALAGSKPRDLSLVEKIECTQSGSIYFVSTSVETPKVPCVSNKIRAHIVLNGWVLEPLSYDPPRTKATYVLQIKVKGWVPSILSKTYLAKRPLVLYTIEQYLRKNGPPQMVISSPTESTFSDISVNKTNTIQSNNASLKYPRKKMSISYLNGRNSSTSTSPTSPTSPASPASSIFPTSPTSPIGTTREIQNDSTPSPASLTQLHSATINLSRPKSPTKMTQHRHTESVQKAFEMFKSHLPMDDWNLYSEDKGLKIYMKEFVGKSTPIMRGDGVISGGFTTYDILSVIKNLDMRKLWDDRYDEGAIYEMFSLHERLARTSMKGTFPIRQVNGRDMSVCEMLDHEEDTGILQFVSTSVVDQLIPESKKIVRANLDFAGWRLKPHFDSEGNTTSVDTTYIVDVDVKLDTIPSSIRKTLSVQIPMIVSKLDELMQKMGFPPYIVNSTTKVIKEEFNIKNHQYDLSLIAEGSGVTEFKISRLMYPNGLDISTIPENCKVELLSESSETIRVTLPQRVDLDNLMITISKHSTKDFQITHNHEKTIPLVSNSTIDVKQFKNTKDGTTSTNTTLVENGTIDGQLIKILSGPQKHKLNTRSIVTPEIFKLSEVSLKSEPHQRMLDRQTLLENKIAAVTRLSREVQNVSDPSEVAPKTSKTLETLKTEEGQLNNRVIENTQDLVDITDSVRFNSQQVGIIFASMLLAYYAGKLSI